MQWLIDTLLPPSFAKYLLKLGEDAIHISNFPEGHLYSDKTIRKIAIETNRIILSKDWDFFDDFFILGHPPKIVHLQIGNCGNMELFSTFERNLFRIIELLNQDCGMVVLSGAEIVGY